MPPFLLGSRQSPAEIVYKSASLTSCVVKEEMYFYLLQLQTVVLVSHQEDLCSIGGIHILSTQGSLTKSNLE